MVITQFIDSHIIYNFYLEHINKLHNNSDKLANEITYPVNNND